MFQGCSGLTSLDLRNWDTRSVTTTNSMLMNCSALTHLNLGGWSGTSLTDTNNMISNCNNLIDVSVFNSPVDFVNTIIGLLPTRTSDSYGNLNVSVENKDGNLGIDSTTAESKYWKLIINYAIAIYRFNKDIDTLPILNITDYSCLDTLNADESITRRVYYDSAPSSMSFNGATGLIEVISLDLSIISTLQDFFKGCTQLTDVRLDGIDFRNITSVQGMFDGCSKFTTSDFSKLDLSSIDTFDRMFANCTSLKALDLSNVKLKSSATFDNFLSNTSSLRKIKLLDVAFDLSKILESLPARTSDNVGYLFLREDYPNDKNWDFEKIHDYCYERGFTIYPGKIASTNTFRLCSLGAIDVNDIEDFFVVFKEALIDSKVAIPVIYKGE
jgi:surface protein